MPLKSDGNGIIDNSFTKANNQTNSPNNIDLLSGKGIYQLIFQFVL